MPERGLREILDDGDLVRIEAGLRGRLAKKPGDLATLRTLGDVLRQQGKLEDAAGVYDRIVQAAPDDVAAVRLRDMLQGNDLGPAQPLPARFAYVRDFLPPERLELLREHVRSHRDRFEGTKVKRSDGGDVDNTATRRSSHLTDLADIRSWFDPLLEARLDEFRRRMDLDPFEAGIHSCKIAAYHDGYFFRMHQDQNSGVAATRMMGFIYYFDFPPRRFHGGELLLYDRNPDTLWPVPSFTNLSPVCNTLAVIPANAWHEVLPVVCADEDWFAARFTYSGWIHDEVLLAEVPEEAR